jgi:hypothetical protein
LPPARTVTVTRKTNKQTKSKNMKTNTINFRAIIRDVPTFAAKIERLKREGFSSGKSILLARRADPKGFSSWMAWRQKTDDGRLQHL